MAAESTRFPTAPRPADASPSATVRPLRAAPAHRSQAQAHAQAQAPFDWEKASLLAAFGALVVAVFIHGGPLAFLAPDVAPMFLPALVGAALLAWRTRAWTFALAGLLMSLPPLLVLFGFGAVAILGKPAMGLEFTGLLFLVLAFVLAAPASIAGVRRMRRGEPPAQPGLRVGATVLTAAFLVGAMVTGALASADLSASGGGAGYDFTPDLRATVVAQDFAFPQEPLRIPAGTITEVVLENRDGAFHTFTYQVGGTTYNHDVAGGATARFLVKFDAPGSIQYWCEPHSGGAPGAKQGMVGTVVVA